MYAQRVLEDIMFPSFLSKTHHPQIVCSTAKLLSREHTKKRDNGFYFFRAVSDN